MTMEIRIGTNEPFEQKGWAKDYDLGDGYVATVVDSPLGVHQFKVSRNFLFVGDGVRLDPNARVTYYTPNGNYIDVRRIS